MVFYNLFIFRNNKEAVDDIRWLVTKLLEDEQLEVNNNLSLYFLPAFEISSKIKAELFFKTQPSPDLGTTQNPIALDRDVKSYFSKYPDITKILY